MKKIIAFFITISMVASIFICPFSATAANTVSGQQIVSKAMEYIGKVPYVWGGKKIDGKNPGADCSGFVCCIYEKFGINLWANRVELHKSGTNLGTDINVAMLGDIIWYSGHVAIYAGKDSSGNHMIVHETGGNYQNVVYTKHAIVSAKLRGVIRIPGVYNDGTAVDVKKATFSKATDSDYTSMEKYAETNACVVTQVNKLSGVKVTKMGLYLYDENGDLIKKYTENVSNVGNSTTKYHSWYDMNKEVGVTLTPGTAYKYAFFGVFDGQEIKGPTRSFKTTGTAPVEQVAEKCTVTFFIDYNKRQREVIEVEKGSAIGALPAAVQQSGYTFEGFYTSVYDGVKVTGNTIVTGDMVLYARYAKIEYAEDTKVVEKCKVMFVLDLNTTMIETMEVEKGSRLGTLPKPLKYSAYNFEGFYSKRNGGYKATPDTIITEKTTFFARYTEKYPDEDEDEYYEEESNEIELTINSAYMYHNGKRKKIDENGTKPFLYNSRTMLPVRAVIEAMGGTVSWNGDNQVVTLKKDGKTLFLKIDFDNAWDIDGNVFKLDAPPMIKNGRTMLPIRFVAEYFGGTVRWNQAEQSVIIEY